MEEGVSVVIPTRDRWDRLRGSLALVLQQTYTGPLEVVVVDDGGSDGTADHLEALRDPRIRVVRNPRSGGVSVARNTGLAAATQPWVAFTDDDDIWSPDKLQRQVAAVSLFGGECWCAGASVSVLEDWTVVDGQQLPPPTSDLSRLALSDNPIPGGGSGVLASTALVRRVGGFDPALSLLADWDLWTRLALTAPFVPVGGMLLAYVVHASSMSLDVRRSSAESAVIRDRYAADRSRLGVARFGGGRAWIAGNHVRAGRRAPAVRLYAALALETRRWHFVRAALGTLCGPTVRARAPKRLKATPVSAPEAVSFIQNLRRALEAAQLATGLDDATWRGRTGSRPSSETEGRAALDEHPDVR